MSAAVVEPNVEIPVPSKATALPALADRLDAASPVERAAWMAGLKPKDIHDLFKLAKGSHLRAEQLVQATVNIGHGKNALPVPFFNQFQKRFARTEDQYVGYNHTPKFSTFFVGPGHFVFYDSPEGLGEVWIDYRELPRTRHPDFPPLYENDSSIGAIVTYAGMIDIMRRVSRHVVVGDAFVAAKPKGVPFVLLFDAPLGG